TNNIDFNALTDAIGLFEVYNNWGLNQGEDNHFVVTPRSGEPIPSEDRKLVRQALEMSTVDLASEMVHLIETHRSYQLSARVVTTSDELMSIANNLRN
ncbi:MAG: flagellar hook-basal body protein, partial [Ruminiclostridium sp.]|nr:flagellar hook-basal body protein [Ruminiclostridium sp.]